MGAILSFADRVRDSGRWTASERNRLEALTERFFGGGEGLHVAYGATDDGAPWCAVMDEADEVLVHVARVAGQFIVHFVNDDVMARGADLSEALGQWLSPEPERTGVVVPFNRAHNGQNMLVLLAVAGFLEEQLKLFAPQIAEGVASLSADPPAAEPTSPTEPIASPEKGQDAAADEPDSEASVSEAAARTLTPSSAEAAPQTGSAPQPASVESVATLEIARPEAQPASAPSVVATLILGSEGDDVLVGGPDAEWLIGADGGDMLIGGGGRDTLDGGPGDDRIMLTPDAVAYGGAGADTFVVSAPLVLDDPDTLLGTVFDFSASEGDTFVAAQGELVILTPSDSAHDDLAFASKSDVDQRLSVDFNGDGRADGYILLTGSSSYGGADQHPVGLAGVSSDEPEIIG